MKGFRFALIAAVILGALLYLEMSNIASWGRQSHPGDQSVPGPLIKQGTTVQSNSTLTHGQEVDRPRSLKAEQPAGTQTSTDSEQMSRRDFRQFLRTVLDKLPTQAQAAKLKPSDVHHEPQMLLNAGSALGGIAERIEKTEILKPDALDFYKDCAQDQALFRSVRALCFNRAQLLSVELFQDIWEYDQLKVPRAVVELAKTL